MMDGNGLYGVRDSVATMDQEADSDAFEDLLILIGEGGLSPGEAIDYYGTEVRDLSATELADRRGVSNQAVSRNAKAGASKLPPDIDF